MLLASRESRGVLQPPLRIFAGEETVEHPDVDPGPDTLWVPHVYCWEREDAPALAWELLGHAQIESTFHAPLAALRRWAEQPQKLLALGTAHAAGPPDQATGHLSLRWVLLNETLAAAAGSAELVTLEHVSVHVSAEEEYRLVAALVDGLGAMEVTRPAAIEAAGRWLQAGPVRLHLNSRDPAPDEPTFPGTAPNHICFAVADLDTAVAAVERSGFAIVRAGSLGAQAWFRLSTGTTIELQQKPSPGAGQP